MRVQVSININGTQITPAMSMTIRVALIAFATDLQETGIEEDELGKNMTELYLKRVREIFSLINKEYQE